MYYIRNIRTGEYYSSSLLREGVIIDEHTVTDEKDAYGVENLCVAEKIVEFDVVDSFEWEIV